MTSQSYLFLLLGPAVLAAAFHTQTAWLYLIGAAALALLAASGIAAGWNLRGVRLVAMPVPAGHQGAPLKLRVRLSRRAGLSRGLQVLMPPRRPPFWMILWRGELLPAGWPESGCDRLAPDAPADLSLPLATDRRGEFPLPDLYVQSAFPLGLVALWKRHRPEGAYLVYPVGPRLEGLPWLAGTALAAADDRATATGHGLLIRGVREYRQGDSWRQIHWRTLARLGSPYVKETEIERGQTLTIFLDLRASVHSEATIEHMVTLAASIVAFCREAGRPVVVETQPEARPEPAAAGLDPELTMLARARAVAPDAPLLGPEGALLLSPVAAPGWRAWAAHFLHCPARAAGAVDATISCPVGEAIAGAVTRRAA
ncbi:MAG: DUF58 domain-containing protein [Candidatus Sericytochromatia bacterium]